MRNRLLSALLALCMVLALLPAAALAAEINYDSIDIYVENRKVWMNTSDWYFPESSYSYGLIDFDGDGIPELFSSGRGGTGLVSQNHYYKVDVDKRSVYEMKGLPEELYSLDLLSGTRICHDAQTDRLLYFSSDGQRHGWQYSNAMEYLFYMQNGAVSAKPIWGWECETDTSTYKDKYTYFYYNDSGSRVETGESDWKQYQEKYWSEYSLLTEDLPVSEATAMRAANDKDLAAALRGLYITLYQSLGAAFLKAELSKQNLMVNGAAADCEMYNIGGRNYFKLRDLAQLLSGTASQFEVGYDDTSKTVSITTGAPYTPNGSELGEIEDKSSTAQPSAQTIVIDGQTRDDLAVYNIGGSNFFQLRELGTALGFDVDYNTDTSTAIVNSK